MLNLSSQLQKRVIAAITIGSVLEWYEVFLFIYWAPTLSEVFFGTEAGVFGLINTLALFGAGLLARPVGGILFGRIGDRYGRRLAVLLSIICLTIPTVVVAMLPTYAEVGVVAPMLLLGVRFLQGFPAGGEMPGIICFLAESSTPQNARFMTSWSFVGPQLGIILSVFESLFLEKLLTPDQLVEWGWRISFFFGGCIGFLGIFLRRHLKETPFFEVLEHHAVRYPPLGEIVSRFKRQIVGVGLLALLNVVGFFLISVFFPSYLAQVFHLTRTENLMFTVLLLLIATIPLPFFGYLGDRLNNRKMLITCGSLVAGLTILFYAAITAQWIWGCMAIQLLMTLVFSCLFALMPYVFADFFPTAARFTCVGLSFNLCSSLFGSFVSPFTLYLSEKTQDPGSFAFILFGAALISLTAFIRMREERALH